MCDMTPSYVWHASFISVTRLVHMCIIIHLYVWLTHSCAWLYSFICVTPLLIHAHHPTRLHVWHDSFTRVTRLIHTCDTTHSHVWPDSFTRVTRLVHTSDTTCSHVWPDALNSTTCTHIWHNSFTCIFDMTPSHACLTWLLHIHVTTHSHGHALLLTPEHGKGKHCRVLLHMCAMPSHVHHAFTCAPWIQLCAMNSHVRHDSMIYVPMYQDSFTRAARLIHTCETSHSHSHVWPDSFICVTRLIHTCGTSH